MSHRCVVAACVVLCVACVTATAASLALAPSAHEVLAFATGYDGPIDDADDWRYFDFSRVTTIVSMGGGVPRNLVKRAHANVPYVKVLRADVLDIDATNKTAAATWAADAAAAAAEPGADGVHVVAIRNQRAGSSSAVTAALQLLRQALSKTSVLSVSLPLSPPLLPPKQAPSATNAASVDREAVAALSDFVVLEAFDQCIGASSPHANIELPALARALEASTLAPQKTVVALPWHGWDFRCAEQPAGSGAGTGCSVLPPAGRAATWHGWNVQRSAAFIISTLAPQKAPPALNSTAMTRSFNYADSTGARHVVIYDDPGTLREKFQACAAAKVRGVGVWTADMLTYGADPAAKALAAEMWGALDGFSQRRRPNQTGGAEQGVTAAAAAAAADARAAPESVPEQAPVRPPVAPRLRRLTDRFLRRAGLPPLSIPGFDPCRRANATPPSTPRGGGCFNGLVCISPLPNAPAPGSGNLSHESGGCYPVRPSISFVARTLVPPLPPTFRPEQATVYYYLNLVMPDDGNSDVTNSTKGYGQ
jgi:hypothetical protein